MAGRKDLLKTLQSSRIHPSYVVCHPTLKSHYTIATMKRRTVCSTARVSSNALNHVTLTAKRYSGINQDDKFATITNEDLQYFYNTLGPSGFV